MYKRFKDAIIVRSELLQGDIPKLHLNNKADEAGYKVWANALRLIISRDHNAFAPRCSRLDEDLHLIKPCYISLIAYYIYCDLGIINMCGIFVVSVAGLVGLFNSV